MAVAIKSTQQVRPTPHSAPCSQQPLPPFLEGLPSMQTLQIMPLGAGNRGEPLNATMPLTKPGSQHSCSLQLEPLGSGANLEKASIYPQLLPPSLVPGIGSPQKPQVKFHLVRSASATVRIGISLRASRHLGRGKLRLLAHELHVASEVRFHHCTPPGSTPGCCKT